MIVTQVADVICYEMKRKSGGKVCFFFPHRLYFGVFNGWCLLNLIIIGYSFALRFNKIQPNEENGFIYMSSSG